MNTGIKSNWVVVFDGPEAAAAQNFKMFNLDQVRMVDQIRHDHIRLRFSETNAVELSGKSAGQLARLLISRGIDVNGIQMPEFLDISILDQPDQ